MREPLAPLWVPWWFHLVSCRLWGVGSRNRRSLAVRVTFTPDMMVRLERHSTRLNLFTSSLIREIVECWVIDMDRLMASVDPSWGEMDLDAQASLEVEEERDMEKGAVVNALSEESAEEARRLREEIVKINTRIDALHEMAAEKAERLRKVMNGEVDLAGLDSGIVDLDLEDGGDADELCREDERAIDCTNGPSADWGGGEDRSGLRGGARAVLREIRKRLGAAGGRHHGAEAVGA